ncbi:polysaccharide deacetylase family protein [Hippea alviniae]|uniref:polysaccharide deacetylase family protein n=1 Tax=Hippea alviniae TaxID=1279027 RepID=UPI0003B50096|nr:polysaccharide deacetylase family protein [Hippea alviniae]
MRKAATVMLIIFIFTILKANACTILIYHKVGDNRTPSTNVSIERFKEQMQYLIENNYRIMPLKELVNLIEKRKNLPKKCVVITFDDGYRSVFKNAFPIIKRYKIPATVFLPTEAIEKHYPDYLTMKQIKIMQQYNIDFQSHSYSHPHFTNPPKGLTKEKYKAWIKNDLKKSIEFFEKYLGYKPYAFAIPYGDYNKTVIESAKELGFKAILTQDATALNKNTPLWLLPRQPILGKYWSTMKHFKEILNETYLDVKKRIPDIGDTAQPSIIGGIVNGIDRYKPNSFKVYCSQYGWIKANTKGNLVFIKAPKLTKRVQRVGIMALKKNGKVAKTLWMIVVE